MPINLRSQSASWPAPIGGWNARDPEAAMAPEDALVLKNCIPQNSKVELRKGSVTHATGMAGVVETLAEYAKQDGTRKLIAASDNKIYDCTSAATATDITGTTTPTSNRWQTTNVNDVLVMVNGEDTPQSYNGTTVSDLSITGSGLTSSNLIHVTIYKGRAYYTEKNTASVWYAGAGAHSGATTEFDLSAIFKKGGYIQFCTSWTKEGGDGLQEVFVAVSHVGEMVVYSGDNPGAANWALIGKFDLPIPLGRRGFTEVGSDLLLLTEEGVIPISAVLSAGGNISAYAKLSDKINDAFTSATRTGASNFGWQPIVYPRAHLILVNCPKTTGVNQEQFVLNSQTGAWCLFTGLNANCWCLLNEKIYFGGNDGNVYQWDTGDDDSGTYIEFEVKTAFNYFGEIAKKKHFKLARAHIISDGAPSFAFDVDVDFRGKVATQVVTTTGGAGAVWDDEDWDVATWGSEGIASADWRTLTGLGRSAALMIKGSFKDVSFSISSFDIIYETGGYL